MTGFLATTEVVLHKRIITVSSGIFRTTGRVYKRRKHTYCSGQETLTKMNDMIGEQKFTKLLNVYLHRIPSVKKYFTKLH